MLSIKEQPSYGNMVDKRTMGTFGDGMCSAWEEVLEAIWKEVGRYPVPGPRW